SGRLTGFHDCFFHGFGGPAQIFTGYIGAYRQHSLLVVVVVLGRHHSVMHVGHVTHIRTDRFAADYRGLLFGAMPYDSGIGHLDRHLELVPHDRNILHGADGIHVILRNLHLHLVRIT